MQTTGPPLLRLGRVVTGDELIPDLASTITTQHDIPTDRDPRQPSAGPPPGVARHVHQRPGKGRLCAQPAQRRDLGQGAVSASQQRQEERPHRHQESPEYK